MNVPRETKLPGLPADTFAPMLRIRPLPVRKAVADAFRAELKTAARFAVTYDNSLVQPGSFARLDLESGRVRRDPDTGEARLRMRCEFGANSSRAVTVSPMIGARDIFWMRDGQITRAASPITLEVVSVGVARLQDMTDADALAEGVALLPGKFRHPNSSTGRETTPREWFARHWDVSRPAGQAGVSWAANPWVWIYNFKSYRRNIDDMLAAWESRV